MKERERAYRDWLAHSRNWTVEQVNSYLKAQQNLDGSAVVALRRSLEHDGRTLSKGQKGIVVHAYLDRDHYEVEFTEPFHGRRPTQRHPAVSLRSPASAARVVRQRERVLPVLRRSPFALDHAARVASHRLAIG